MTTAKKLLERLFNYLFVNQFIYTIFELWHRFNVLYTLLVTVIF